MIIVTGATGQLGRSIVEQLLTRLPADRIGVSARDPGKAADLAARGVRVRRGDFAEPSTLVGAFEGAEQVLMVSSNAGAYGGDPLAQHRAAIEAAHRSGVARIVYTSHMAASPTSMFGPARDHAATEAMLSVSGMAWTSLRNGFYASTVLRLLGNARDTGLVTAPVDGKVSWTAHSDLAAAAAIILAGPSRYEGPTPPLTSLAALDLADLAAIATDVYGRSVRREMVSDDAQQAQLSDQGLPPALIKLSLGMYQASRNGEFAAVDQALERLLGCRPMDIRTVIEGVAARGNSVSSREA